MKRLPSVIFRLLYHVKTFCSFPGRRLMYLQWQWKILLFFFPDPLPTRFYFYSGSWRKWIVLRHNEAAHPLNSSEPWLLVQWEAAPQQEFRFTPVKWGSEASLTVEKMIPATAAFHVSKVSGAFSIITMVCIAAEFRDPRHRPEPHGARSGQWPGDDPCRF